MLVLFFVVVILFGYISSSRTAWRGAALTVAAVALLVSIGVGWRLNYGPLMHLGYQPLAGIPPSTGLVELAKTLDSQAEARAGDATLLDTTLAGVTGPALRWQLRNYRHLTEVNTLSEGSATTAIITPDNYTQGLDLPQAYFGQSFALDAVWSPVGLPAKGFINWLIFRQADDRPHGNSVVLWLRVDEP